MGGRFSVVWLLGCRIAAVKDLAVVLGSRFAFRGLALAKDFAVVWLMGHRFVFCRLVLVKDFAVVGAQVGICPGCLRLLLVDFLEHSPAHR